MNLNSASLQRFVRKWQGAIHALEFISPIREWALGILLFVVVFSLGTISAGLMFLAAGERLAGEGQGHASTTPIEYSHAEIEMVLEAYRARRDTFEVLSGGPAVPPPQAPQGSAPVAE